MLPTVLWPSHPERREKLHLCWLETHSWAGATSDLRRGIWAAHNLVELSRMDSIQLVASESCQTLPAVPFFAFLPLAVATAVVAALASLAVDVA